MKSREIKQKRKTMSRFNATTFVDINLNSDIFYTPVFRLGFISKWNRIIILNFRGLQINIFMPVLRFELQKIIFHRIDLNP